MIVLKYSIWFHGKMSHNRTVWCKKTGITGLLMVPSGAAQTFGCYPLTPIKIWIDTTQKELPAERLWCEGHNIHPPYLHTDDGYAAFTQNLNTFQILTQLVDVLLICWFLHGFGTFLLLGMTLNTNVMAAQFTWFIWVGFSPFTVQKMEQNN